MRYQPGQIRARRSGRERADRGGMALVITLGLLVLATMAVMAFFVRATTNRSVEVARSHRVLSGEVAATAIDYTLAALQNEITDPNNSTPVKVGDVTYYRPVSAATAAPQRMVPADVLPPELFPHLLRRSAEEPGEANASSHRADTPSRDGRTIPAERWNAPKLNLEDGFSGSGQLPRWIYLDRQGEATGAPAADAIGRFAYVVYDTAGLIDANVAGTATNLAPKGTPLTADLAGAVAGSPIDPGLLRQWRSPGLDDGGMLESWHTTGGLRPPPGGKMFTSRQDLLRALEQGQAGLGGGSDLAPHLTHFTRERNAPSLPFLDAETALGFPAYAKNQFAAFYGEEHTFTGYRDDGTSYTYKLEAGAPVLHKRFSLGKLGREDSGFKYWLTPTGPGPGISEAAIKAVFGLRWNDAEERWDYTSPDGNATTDKIKTLQEVAEARRPPDFFEILLAGLNPDSLGGRQAVDGATALTDGERARQGSTDLHVLRIGANMIDQADNDNYPTRIGFELGGADIEAAGVEDLPYLFGAALRTLYTRNGTLLPPESDGLEYYGFNYDKFRLVMSPVLFNPHRAGAVAATGPAALSADLYGGKVVEFGDRLKHDAAFLRAENYPEIALQASSLAIPTTPAAFRLCPQNINNRSVAEPAINSFVAFELPAGAGPRPQGLQGGDPLKVPKTDVDDAVTKMRSRLPGVPSFPILKLGDLRLGLTYTSPKGQKRVYDSLAGSALPGWGVDTGGFGLGWNLNHVNTGSPATYTGTFSPNANYLIWSALFLKFDPRSTRYGLLFSKDAGSEGSDQDNNFHMRNLETGAAAGGQLPLGAGLRPGRDSSVYQIPGSDPDQGTPGPPVGPVGGFSFVPNTFFVGGTNETSDTQLLNIQDRPQDASAVRPNDGFFDNNGSANALRSDDAAEPKAYTASPIDSPKRPVILQRPFRNVAELGYVYRDQPWKSVNFFHENSPDLALLDLFSIGEIEPDVVAGKAGANSAGLPGWKALVGGAGTILATGAGAYSAPLAGPAATGIASNLADTVATSRQLTPGALLTNLGTLSGVITAQLGTIKTQRETLARSLAGTTQTSAWNLLIDIIAQAGRFPAGGTTGAGDFVVGGEQRYWIHVALDRHTGEIIDIQREAVAP